MRHRLGWASILGLAAAWPLAAHAQDISCNNGIVRVSLHLDVAEGTITMEGASYHVELGGPRIAFSTTDAAGDKIDYVLDRAAHRLVETDHDRMPDGSFKTIGLHFTCSEGGQ